MRDLVALLVDQAPVRLPLRPLEPRLVLDPAFERLVQIVAKDQALPPVRRKRHRVPAERVLQDLVRHCTTVSQMGLDLGICAGQTRAAQRVVKMAEADIFPGLLHLGGV